jgi:hypothetical protein
MNGAPVLTPAARMPWPVQGPFRMRPGLVHLDHADTPRLFLRDDLAPAYRAHKTHALDTHRDEALVGDSDPAILAAIAQLHEAETGMAVEPELDALTLALQEDFVVLRDGDTMTTECLSVCFPSNWRPQEKHGLGFDAIHAPVADNQLLLAGANGIIDLAFRQRRMQRHVWLLTPSADLSQHPHAQRTRWDALATATPQELLAHTYFRVERQTTLPLPHLQAGVFFIRVMVCPLADVLACVPERAGELREALVSMSDAVVAYRGMEGVRDRLVGALG